MIGGTPCAEAIGTVVAIRTDSDIVDARRAMRELAASMSFSAVDLAMIATAVSELARNILVYARRGEIELASVQTPQRRGILVEARDDGPGIADVQLAMTDGFSSSNSLGLGLPGSRRLMDDFKITSALGAGTTVTAHKWASE